MLFKEKLKEELEKETNSIKIRGELSGTTYIEAKITNITRKPITLGTPIEQLKIGLQILNSGSISFSEGNFRIDNSHNLPLHLHCSGAIQNINSPTLSGALLMVLGSDYNHLTGNFW